MAKIMITSDPYKQEISYSVFDETTNQWQKIDDVDANGHLRAVENKKCFLPFRVKEIINLIVSEYGSSEEIIDVVFQGTHEEFEDVRKICESTEFLDKISLSFADAFLEDARFILDDTKKLFEKVHPIIKKIVKDDASVCRDLAKVSDALDDIIPICVFGNYSSGKSTFINALIGYEILPNGEDPVTAKIYEITQSEHEDFARILFSYHDDLIDLEFKNGALVIEKGDRNSDILTDLMQLFIDEPENGMIACINRTLAFINAYEKVDPNQIDISSIIKVEVPFSQAGLLGRSKNKFVIFDTPGSNSASNADHSRILGEALQGFSNGIPVWISQYDALDSNDNDDLCDRVLEIEALDKRFTMIVVNKADSPSLPREGFTPKQRKNILEYRAVEKMYAAGIFFVSSIMGLGAKNNGEFFSNGNNGYEEKYYTEYDKFANPNHRFYKRLYAYDIMPEQIKVAMEERCADLQNLIYVNSGLYFVEQEMEDFAGRYSAYNKCQMVYMFLTGVIAETNRRIAQRTDTLKRTRTNRQRELDAKSQELILMLNGIAFEKDREFIRVSKNDMWNYIEEHLQYVYDSDDLETLDDKVAEHYAGEANIDIHENLLDSSKEARKQHLIEHGRRLFSKDFLQVAGKMLDDFQQDSARVKAAQEGRDAVQKEIDNLTSDAVLECVVERYKDDFTDAKQKLSESIKSAWLQNAAILREKLLSAVTGSDVLSRGQREQLSGIILDYKALEFDDDADDVFIKAKFLRGKFLGFDADAERLNIRRLTSKYNERIAKNIASMAQILYDSCYASFKAWMSSLIALVEKNITEYNPDLRDMAEMIREETEKIIELENDQKTISDTLDTIKQLMDWKARDTEEISYGN